MNTKKTQLYDDPHYPNMGVVKNTQFKLSKILVMPISFYFGGNDGIALHILYIDTGKSARSLLTLEYNAGMKRYCFDIFFLGIYLP